MQWKTTARATKSAKAEEAENTSSNWTAHGLAQMKCKFTDSGECVKGNGWIASLSILYSIHCGCLRAEAAVRAVELLQESFCGTS